MNIKSNIKEIIFTNTIKICYSYDRQGNTIEERESCVEGEEKVRYKYNVFGQTVKLERIRRKEEEKREEQENLYDGEGMRYGIIENGNQTNFITNGFWNIVETDENYQEKKRLIRGSGNGLVAEETKEYRYYHENEHRDIEVISNEEGEKRSQYEYDVFGGGRREEEEKENRYRYSGEMYDKIGEQIYLRARYYNAKIGKFTQEDIYRGDGLNLYVYCRNNPVMYCDPSGYGSWELGVEIFKALGIKAPTTAIRGGYEAQHLIPQASQSYSVIKVTDFKMDASENGIFARNVNITDKLNPYLKGQGVTNTQLLNKFITNKVHHGYDGQDASYCHVAYNSYVLGQLDKLAKDYGLPLGKQDNFDVNAYINKLGPDKIKSLKTDLAKLQSNLRKDHQNGVDLYLKNAKNIYETDYVKAAGGDKVKAQEDFEKRFKCTNGK